MQQLTLCLVACYSLDSSTKFSQETRNGTLAGAYATGEAYNYHKNKCSSGRSHGQAAGIEAENKALCDIIQI